MISMRLSILSLVMLLCGCATEMAGVKTLDTNKGTVLTDARGMTLYNYDRDAAGKSNCNAQCAVNWPPLKADSAVSSNPAWTVIKRDDGSLQWAYKGKALYGWGKDQKPGDTTGDGVGGVWRVARP